MGGRARVASLWWDWQGVVQQEVAEDDYDAYKIELMKKKKKR